MSEENVVFSEGEEFEENEDFEEDEAPSAGVVDTTDAEAKKQLQRKLKFINSIQSKTRRVAEYQKWKKQMSKLKQSVKKKRKKAGKDEDEPQKKVPKTIENQRVPDETIVKEGDETAIHDLQNDSFKEYFERTYEPKVLITTADNPHKKTNLFVRELTRIIPNSEFRFRNRSGVKKMVQAATERGFTDILIVNEDMKQPNGLLVVHLPDGPTANFKISNVKLTTDIKRNWKSITNHRPEVILTNFTTRLGHGVGRMLAALFHYDPEFRGRRAVTFHNQRDYIFFRHHRYDFKNEKKVSLREMGPRFTLKLRSLQKGTFDSKTGEYEWIITGKRHQLETSRRRFFL